MSDHLLRAADVGADDVLHSVEALASALKLRQASSEELKLRAGSLRWSCARTLAQPAVERTLRRLFPWAPGPDEADPWEALLWANGRKALGERKLETKWLWHCEPLDEWNGEIRRQKPRR